MSKLPRTRVLANKNLTKNARLSKSDLRKDRIALDTVCDKHNIKELTFRSVRFVTADGVITTVDHNMIRGNVNNGIFFIESPSQVALLDQTYDIVTIKKEKILKDRQKQIDKQNKSKLEMERLNQQMLKDLETLKADDDEVPDLVDIADAVSQNDVPVLVDIADANPDLVDVVDVIPDLVRSNVVDDDITDTESEVIPDLVRSNVVEDDIADTESDAIPDLVGPDGAAVDDTTDENVQPIQRAKKVAKTTGNKFFRNFMKDLKGKFKLSFHDEYEYCEFRKEATDMIIEGANIHKVVILNSDVSYYVIIGSMQMKRIAIKQIDPSYGVDAAVDAHDEFMEKMVGTEKVAPSNSEIGEVVQPGS